MHDKQQSGEQRREFLKKAAKTSVVIAAGGVALTGCSGGSRIDHLNAKQSKKVEILYQKSPQWTLYYSVAK